MRRLKRWGIGLFTYFVIFFLISFFVVEPLVVFVFGPVARSGLNLLALITAGIVMWIRRYRARRSTRINDEQVIRQPVDIRDHQDKWFGR